MLYLRTSLSLLFALSFLPLAVHAQDLTFPLVTSNSVDDHFIDSRVMLAEIDDSMAGPHFSDAIASAKKSGFCTDGSVYVLDLSERDLTNSYVKKVLQSRGINQIRFLSISGIYATGFLDRDGREFEQKVVISLCRKKYA